MSHTVHFAGINTRGLAEAARGADVLISFADVKRSPGFWAWMRPMIEGGHFRSVILDSGAFTELSQRKLGKVFTVGIEEFAAFAAEHQALFAWVANLDSIEGDVVTSNRNLAALAAAGVRNVVPVYHEGESVEQLAHCLAFARERGVPMAVGCQRPKGSLVPSNVVRFLSWLFGPLAPSLDGVRLHGFGLTRYASDACPAGRAFPFDSTDSTTWIAEACAVERAGCYTGTVDRIHARRLALRAVVASFGVAEVPADFDHEAAERAGGQARTVSRRLRARG